MSMITMEDIVREGHPSLRTVADKVDIPSTYEEKQKLKEMHTFLINSQDDNLAQKYNLRAGVGLAAPQLGINKRMIVVHFHDANEKLHSYALFNPKVISHSVEQAYLANGEGCLSVDRPVEGLVVRHRRITVKAYDSEDNPIKLRLRDYGAIVVQHEIDHLDGIMFYDYINEKNPLLAPPEAKRID